MSRYTKQQLREALQKLPQDIQDIIMSSDRSDVFHTIMKKHSLTVAQIAAVADALAPVTFGLMVPKELPNEIRRGLPMLESPKVDALVADINAMLLAPIRTRVMEAAHNAQPPLAAAAPTQSPAAVHTPPTDVPRALGADLAQAKTTGTFHLPPDSVTVKAPATDAPTASIPKPKPIAPVRDGKYAATDPYREPTE